jgi:ABC-2 type transport system ATP-binding protein
MTQALQVENLKKIYHLKAGIEIPAVKGVSFDVKPGEIFGLLGPNGAGKTTIISNITTLEKPTSGEVKVFGQSVVQNSKWTKKQIGIVAQEIVTQGFFNLEEILTFQSGYYGIWNNNERIQYLLQKLGLYEHRHKLVKQLSGGMKRRLMIAKALVHNPRLLLLDEPTAGVDIELRNSLWSFVRELKQQGMSILLTTHYLQEAEELCDRVGIIHRGELRYVGETQGIIHQLTKRQVEITFNDGDWGRLKTSPYYQADKDQSYYFSIPYDVNVGGLLTQLQINVSQIRDLKTREGSLEDAFLSVLHNKKEVRA